MVSEGALEAAHVSSCVHILGVPVNVLGKPEVLSLMERWVQQRERRWIAVTSSHGIVEGYKHPEFKAILKSADLSLADGKWTARWAARRAATAPKQVRGADLLMEFCELSSQKGYRNFFYGDTEEVLASLTGELRRKFPSLNVLGTYSPPFRATTAEEDEHIIRLINEAHPDVLWVGLGLPKQEQWIFKHRDELNAAVLVAVGAAFKFVSGKVRRAPNWISECGLEWMWRLAHEPRKVWHRAMIYGPQFAGHALLELTGLRKYD